MKFDSFLDWSGKVGNYVICTYRGKKYVRRRPRKTTPPSPRQRAQRERMASVGSFYTALKSAGLYPYWEKAAEGQLSHGYNLITRENMPAFQADGKICDFSKLQLTPSLLPLPDHLQLSKRPDGSWLLQWTNSPCMPGATNEDFLRVFLMGDTENFTPVPVDSGSTCREDNEATFALPEKAKDYSHLYVAFCSQASGKCSRCKYFDLEKLA